MSHTLVSSCMGPIVVPMLMVLLNMSFFKASQNSKLMIYSADKIKFNIIRHKMVKFSLITRLEFSLLTRFREATNSPCDYLQTIVNILFTFTHSRKMNILTFVFKIVADSLVATNSSQNRLKAV